MDRALGRKAREVVDRWDAGVRFRFRPGFMAVTAAVALLATPTLGLLAERMNDEQAVENALIEDADEALRQEMLEQGFLPLESLEPAVLLRSAQGVELMAAECAFRLKLMTGALSGSPPDSGGRARSERARAWRAQPLSEGVLQREPSTTSAGPSSARCTRSCATT